VIQHATGHVTVMDVCNASAENELLSGLDEALAKAGMARGNFNQKDYPVNPINYLKRHGITDVFRFILSHPDMDHLGGFKAFCKAFPPTNFWDIANREEKEFGAGSPYDEEDWLSYKSIRDGNRKSDPKRLVLCSGARGQFYNRDENGDGGGDGLYVLAPTPELIASANASGDFNDTSYVVLYRSAGGRVLFAGDSHDATWEHILENHAEDVRDVDLLIAPHHGRKSDRSYDFLTVVNPTLTLFGNANSEHLAYNSWNYRKLPFITNNQANCIVIDTNVKPMAVYVTYETFARNSNPQTFYSQVHQAHYLSTIKTHAQLAASRLLSAIG
jgi:competence protein ComEC